MELVMHTTKMTRDIFKVKLYSAEEVEVVIDEDSGRTARLACSFRFFPPHLTRERKDAIR